MGKLKLQLWIQESSILHHTVHRGSGCILSYSQQNDKPADSVGMAQYEHYCSVLAYNQNYLIIIIIRKH